MNLAQIAAFTAQRMALVDAVHCTPDQKDDLRSTIGFQHHVMSLSSHAFHVQQLHVPSPLSQPTMSNLNMEFVRQRVQTCFEGPIHAIDHHLHPFTRVLLVREAFKVKIIPKQNAPYNLRCSTIPISISACAVCNNSNNLECVVVQGEVHHAEDDEVSWTETGITFICRTHARNDSTVKLSYTAQVLLC